MRIELGTRVRCTDKPYGELADVVVDPISKRVTHLVVRPTDQEALETRLVPIELVDNGDEGSELSLRCTVEEVNALEPVREYAYLRVRESAANDPNWDIGVQDVLASPYYEVDPALGYPGYPTDLGLIYDRVPKGEVEIRRSSDVYSADEHHLGEVDGFLVDGEAHITHAHPRARPSLGAARRHDPDRGGRQGRDRCRDAQPLEGPGGRAPVGSSSAPRAEECAWQESNLLPAPEARALSPELQALGGQV